MSASGIFSHSKAEAILQQLLDTTKRHEKELSALHKLYNIDSTDGDGGKVILHKIRSIEGRMNEMSNRLDAVEKCIQIPGGMSSLTVGEAVAANRKTLARALSIIATKADAEEVKAGVSSSKVELDVALKELKNSFADNAAVEKMNDALAALSNRMDVVSNDVQNKVDNASFKVICSDANIIRNHASFVQRTDEASKKLGHDLESQKKKIGKQEELVQGVSNTIARLEKDLKERATMKELKCLTEKIGSVALAAEGKARKDDVKRLQTNLGVSVEKISRVEKDLMELLSSHDRLSIHLGRRIDDVAVSSEKQIETCVRNDQLHSVFCDLKAELAAKAWAQSVEDLERTTVALKSDFGVTKKKAELAAQFVAWYGNRGDTYEHNLQAVDAHLKNLATSGARR